MVNLMNKFILSIFIGGSLFASNSILLPISFQSYFKQIITNEKKKKIIYNGNMLYSKGNIVKWNYNKPTKKEVCTNNKNLIVIDHDLEQITRYRLSKAINLPKIIKNAKFRRKQVYIAKYEDKSYTIQVDKDGKLMRIAYYDDLDNTVLIIFDKIRYSNKTINIKKLECKIPKEYDIIDG